MDTINMYVSFDGGYGNREAYKTINDALRALEIVDRTPTEILDEQENNRPYPAPDYNVTPVTIYIGEGIYYEQVVINRPKVTIIGAGRDKTIIKYDLAAVELLEDGMKRGTFRTATFRVNAPDFYAEGLTIQNTAGYGAKVGQALAVYVDGDRACFKNCGFSSYQDTLFTAPLPEQEFEKFGFRGPGEHRARTQSRQAYFDCYIEGHVDFIFGSAQCWFENCEIFTRSTEAKRDEENPVYGYCTAASHPQGLEMGYVFNKCRLTSDCPDATVYLGRPWREFAQTVYIDCEMGAHIKPCGWHDWGKAHGSFYYAESNSTGAGANNQAREDYSHILTKEETDKYLEKRDFYVNLLK